MYKMSTLGNIIKGKCWIGDPCYVCKDWDSFCTTLFAIPGNEHCAYDKNGIKVDTIHGSFYVAGTKHGDGCYDCKVNGKKVASLGVDAGMLSVIPFHVVNNILREGDSLDCGVWLELDGEFKAKDGNFSVGTMKVKTH